MENFVNTPAPTYSGVGDSISDKANSLEQAIAILENSKVKFKFNSGTSTDSLFNNSIIRSDDFHIASWFLYTTKLTELNIDEVNDAKHTILYSDKLINVVNESTTASDSLNYKFDLISKAQIGDILIFDTFKRNSSAGIYLGSNLYLTVMDTNYDNDLIINKLWDTDDFNNIEITESLNNFNGNIKRIPQLDEDSFKWYLAANGIDNLI